MTTRRRYERPMSPDRHAAPAALGHLPELFLPDGFRSEAGSPAQIVDGIPAWFVCHSEDGDYTGLYVHTHREVVAHAVTTYMLRTCEVDAERVEIVESGWCLLVTVCGCTPAEHATHGELDGGCEDACRHPELEPCNPEPIYGWLVELCAVDAPGALPYVKVVLS